MHGKLFSFAPLQFTDCVGGEKRLPMNLTLNRNVSVRDCFILCFSHLLLTAWVNGGEGVPVPLTVGGGALGIDASG